jgi:hypothetical protein
MLRRCSYRALLSLLLRVSQMADSRTVALCMSEVVACRNTAIHFVVVIHDSWIITKGLRFYAQLEAVTDTVTESRIHKEHQCRNST